MMKQEGAETFAMKRILLLLSFLRRSPGCIDLALQIAAERHAELVVLFVLDMDIPAAVSRKLTEDGWIGGKPSERFLEALRQEYEEQADAKLGEVKEAANARGIAVRAFLRHGHLVNETMSLLAQEQIDLIVVMRRKRSRLSRFLFGSTVADLMKQAPCPVQVIDEK